MNTQLCPTDLTDSQRVIIQELIPAAKPGGRLHSLDMRQVVNAILHVVVGGIQWRMLPREQPKRHSVYSYCRDWKQWGVWRCIHDTLRVQVRRRAGRHRHPTGGCLDSQSVKTTAVPGTRGFDKAKLINGRKRHVLVDTAGLLMAQFHMQVAGSDFRGFVELLKLSGIDIYGKPSDDLVERLRQKSRMLGSGTVVVHELHAGFTRFGGPSPDALESP